MKNKIFNKSIALSLTLIIIFGLMPFIGFAQPNQFAQPNPSLHGEVKGFNKSVFDSHFSRADREIDPQKWLEEAKLGMSQAIYAWEMIACNLYDNPLLFDEAKEKIEKWSNEELEARFSQWLINRFFSAASEKALMELYSNFSETQKNYSWQLDEDGNIIFDDKTGDPIVIRPFDENREFSGDLLLWRDEADNIVKTNAIAYDFSIDTLIAGLYTELLAFIPEEYRTAMGEVIKETGAKITGSVKREFENIAAREEQIFTSLRTRDIWSLRKKSNDEAARIFTEKLIAQTEEACFKGIEELNARIEQAYAGTGDLALLGEEWLALYKEQFDRGLKAWEEAEERFFMRRIEWEQDSLLLLDEGNEIWLAAFDTFEKERQKWELSAKKLFESGVEMFENISEEFQKSIEQAKEEFELNMAMRTGEGTTRVKALVDMYLICASAAFSAMESLQFWHDRYYGWESINPKDEDYQEWLEEKIEKSPYNSNLQEMKKCYDLYISYMNNAMEARDRIQENYTELFGTGALKDILSPDVSSEDFCLDEYQIALIRAKALVLYWEKKTVITEAVLAYANDLTAGRITEAEGIRAWEDAKKAYNEALKLYESELEELNLFSKDIQSQQEVLYELSQKMSEEEDKLNRLNTEYTTFFTASVVNLSSVYLEELNSFYERLLDKYILLLESGTESDYWRTLEYGMLWDTVNRIQSVENVLNILINGNNNDILSLSQLEELAESDPAYTVDLNIRLANIDLLTEGISGAEWYFNATGTELAEGENLLDRLVSDYQNSYETLLRERLNMEIHLLEMLLEEYSEDEEEIEHIYSEFFLYDEEDAILFLEVLLALRENLLLGKSCFTNNEEENDIINYFLSGGYFFTNSEQYLTEYIYNYIFSLELLNVYNEYADLCTFFHEELLQDMLNSLQILFDDYDIELTTNLLPSIFDICEAILEKQGNFIQNASLFLYDFDNCFNYIPQWLANEINLWKYSFLEYIGAYAYKSNFQSDDLLESLSVEEERITERYENLALQIELLNYSDYEEIEALEIAYDELSRDNTIFNYKKQIVNNLVLNENTISASFNEKHWRQYLQDNIIKNKDSITTYASSWKEGLLTDALFNSTYFSNRLNDSLAVFSQKDIDLADIDEINLEYSYLYEYQNSFNDFNEVNAIYNGIANSGKKYDISMMSNFEIRERMELAYIALQEQENTYNELSEEYFTEASHFLSLGSLYDDQYKVVNEAYENINQKRLEYEIQDAIQRWASTAYLGADIFDPENIKANLSRAENVLTVLSDLYNDEDRRSYENPQYIALYSEYEESFRRKMNIYEANLILDSATNEEKSRNLNLHYGYNSSLYQLGNFEHETKFNTSSGPRSSWSIYDVITVTEDGKLVFSKNGSWTLTGVDAAKAQSLNNFFNTKTLHGNERYGISNYEASLRELSQRMLVYFSDSNKFMQWSYAREYLLSTLIEYNSDLLFLQRHCLGLDQIEENGVIGKLQVRYSNVRSSADLYDAANISAHDANAKLLCRQYWDGLTADEKADLEYYIILSLTSDSNDYFYGFSQLYSLNAYKEGYNYVEERYLNAVDHLKTYKVVLQVIFSPAVALLNLGYKEMRDINEQRLGDIAPSLNEKEKIYKKWENGLKNNLLSINSYRLSYANSCYKLDMLEGKMPEGQSVVWENILSTLNITEKFNNDEINEIKSYWEQMLLESEITYSSVPDALLGLYVWAVNKENTIKMALNNFWIREEENQKEKENGFLISVEKYIAGIIDLDELEEFAQEAYGENSSSWKNHYEDMHTVIYNDLNLYTNMRYNFFSEFSVLADEMESVTKTIYENRYNAELAAREAEWNLSFKDLNDKLDEWINSAELIMENGRTDWIASKEKMQASYAQWQINFLDEYNRVRDEWDLAYLAGLEDKEIWLEQAAQAAYTASTESFLSLVGTEGERFSRFMDTREPFGIRDANPEVESLMAELLQSSGITNMYNAFGSINGITSMASPVLKRGLGGPSAWNSALVKSAASDLARKSSAEIAERESKILAYNAREDANKAIQNLVKNVESANQNFMNSMDNSFIFNNLWGKKGNDYVKDIVKGSTLTTPIISQTVIVPGYQKYVMENIELKTKLDDNTIANLDTIAIRILIDNVYDEVRLITNEIFGVGEKVKIINDAEKYHTEKYYAEKSREQSPGKFGAHIGYVPLQKPGGGGKTKESYFYDQGEGELGRLISELIYWSAINEEGNAELGMPSWRKRIWNDDDSWFSSPSLHKVGQIAATVAATVLTCTGYGSVLGVALMALIISSNDILFESLEVAFGYKSFDEGIFNMGKSYATNLVSSAIGGAFSGASSSIKGAAGLTQTAVNSASGTIGKVVTQTAMAGIQTFTTGFATSAISGITYTNSDGFGYSSEIAAAGMKSMLTSTVTSMTSTFVLSSLTAINSGFDGKNLQGLNATQKTDLSTFNNLAGSLAGQGVNYAMGGGFTLNVLNLSQFTGGKYSSGLLELHLGRNGVQMELGTGGANVSFDNLASAFKGSLVWSTNSYINNYVKKNDNFDSNIALRAQYGYGDGVQKSQLWDILRGDTLLMTDSNGDFTAQTTIDANGNRVVTLGGYQLGMSMEDQMRLAVVLGHEAYRDGIVTSDNYLETRTATMAHTEMAIRMILGGEQLAYDSNLAKDIAAYFEGINSFNAYVDANYDSSSDYWRLMEDGRLLYDGDGWLKDPNGNYILDDNDNRIGSNGVQTGLEIILGISSKEAVQILRDQGFVEQGGYWNKGGNDNKSITLNNSLYASIYESNLQQYNTLNIYNAMVANGTMDINPAYQEASKSLWFKGLNFIGLGKVADYFVGIDKYISYEEYKANNFIQGMPVIMEHSPVQEGSRVTSSFGATGNASTNPHRGTDFGVYKEDVYPIFSNDTTRTEVFGDTKYLTTAQGLHINVNTDITYIFKGQEYTDTIVQRMLHMDSISVTNNQAIIASTMLGKSGNTGQFSNGDLYGYHLHTDMYSTGSNGSPWLNYLTTQVPATFNINTPILYNYNTYYDTMIFNHKYNYVIPSNANVYNK